VEKPFVEAIPRSELERVEPVDVVPTTTIRPVTGPAVDREPNLPAAEDEAERSPEACPHAILLGDERRVEPDGHVVQKHALLAEAAATPRVSASAWRARSCGSSFSRMT